MRISPKHEGPLRPLSADSEDSIESTIKFFCEEWRKGFEAGDSTLLIDAYLATLEAGVLPPDWVLQAIYGALAEFMDGDGEQSLEHILALKSAGRGKPSPLKARKDKGKRADRAFAIHLVKSLFKVSVDDAAYMVACREHEREGAAPNASWIAEDYRKNWRSLAEQHHNEFTAHDPYLKTKEARQKILESFPEHSLPPRLKDGR